MNVAILSTTKLPRFLGEDHPDEQALFAEDDLLVTAFAEQGVTAERVPWRQRGLEWGRYDMVLIRSTWDYIDDVPGFLQALSDIEHAGCRLVNPLETVRWNADKRYLAALAEAGVPIVPTRIVEPGQDPQTILGGLEASPNGYIRKPIVGVGAFGAKRFRHTAEIAKDLTNEKVATPYIVQPFLGSVESEGEWSFVFGGGAFLYAALKTPAAGDFRVQVMYGARTRAKIPAADDLSAARECFRALPVTAHFARIDMARLPNGRLTLMEAELIEPQLYFFDVPDAAGMVARAALDLAAEA